MGEGQQIWLRGGLPGLQLSGALQVTAALVAVDQGMPLHPSGHLHQGLGLRHFDGLHRRLGCGYAYDLLEVPSALCAAVIADGPRHRLSCDCACDSLVMPSAPCAWVIAGGPRRRLSCDYACDLLVMPIAPYALDAAMIAAGFDGGPR